MDLNGIVIRTFVFPFMELAKGNKIQQNLTYLKSNQSRSEESLNTLQAEKLKNLLLHCVENVPAYQPFSHLRAKIETDPMNALKQFPVLTKQQFRQSSDAYISKKVNKEDLIGGLTGGSTGEPVRFYLDRHTVEFFEAARWRGLSWWKIRIGDRSAMIWGSPIELTQSKKFVYQFKERFLKNRIVIPAYELNPSSIDAYIQTLNQFKPLYLYGYASSLFLFSQLMLKNQKSLGFTPKAIVSTAETLHDFQREAIQKAFQCPVVNEYGARDGGILAYECPHGKMHISAENEYLEVVDLETKEPLEKGKSGLVLVTDLNNFSMPRLRYQLGDVAELSPHPCTCGISLPVLERIQGREDDIFVSLNGRYVHGHFFNHIARNLLGIAQFQVIQHNRTDLSLKIIKNDRFNNEEIEYFKSEIYQLMGDVNLSVEFVEEIPLTNSGKFRYAIRNFPI